MRRLLLVLAVILVGTVGVVTAATAAGRGGPGLPTLLAKSATVAYAPGPGATDVAPTAPATVTVSDGTFAQVSLVNAKGEPVAGTLTGNTWSTTEPLGYDAQYTWTGTAVGADGVAVPLAGGFHTLAPAKVVRGVLNIGDGRTVGVAAPIEIQFNAHVEDRAAVERALTVETSVAVEGAWGWLPDEAGGSRVHWRPKEYWPAYTKVHVGAKLYGVSYGGGRYGAADVTSDFEIGRAQIVKADAQSFRMVVERDGQQVADYPASYGLASDPDRNTRSGVHVVTEKFTDKRMTSQQYGYDVMEKWAVRMSNNGEFIHANPASAGAQGSSNVTHGCINLSTENARAYYDTALYGDPVEVTGTPVQLSARDGDVWDWTLSWAQWQELSAL
ncbi:Ig-like domain-containing protein [Pseudonocardia sp. WMMC193]|uniref:L,D-transpeptidase n=1 Tax=Pseudonocardia sp. WMMC193 TaxID=2911965 RepID=UPI001F2B04D9|nr:Ig-like domain-containing protein [Pseudonocardia sp. WMMC193]MCF7551443.1 Ig-like domain-containing protein [Pseudonocardia sp. WMMC193]